MTQVEDVYIIYENKIKLIIKPMKTNSVERQEKQAKQIGETIKEIKRNHIQFGLNKK